MPADVAAVVLAAGKGTRFKSDLAKVLHRCAGRSILGHILAALEPLELGQIVVVVGHQADDVEAEARAAGVANLTIALQAEQLGTGHAVQVALPALDDRIRRVVVVPGDTPLLRPDTITGLLGAGGDVHAASMVSAVLDDPTGYGRVIRESGSVARIVEHADASEPEREVREVNAGIYAFERELLAACVGGLDTTNAQGEIYLTDVIEALVARGAQVAAVVADADEVAGVNDRRQLAAAAAALRARTLDRLMSEGVTVLDPATTYVDVDVSIGADTVVYPNCILEEATAIGGRATIGPNCHLVGAEVGDEACVTNAVVMHAVIGPEAHVGPFAYLRPGTVLGRGAKAGGFVEMKNAHIGAGSKVPHLSYIGDATVGRDANVGAGTITCNYDGFDKHETHIGDGAFIGSDTMLVAPVRIGKGAVTGAASAITEDVPDGALAVERSHQRNIDGWADRRREQRGPR
ncbi:MAG TPA: bifunctional UDP-N-acetylglucosamine diphosphorylase/glucosamine-1-phosphate N-acetyltransferase GlmU [Nitriliruptorales bacterium]